VIAYHEIMVFPRSLLWTMLCLCLNAQVIDFESNGLHYKTLTRNGITVMFANLPAHIRDYDIMQVAISNGSRISWTVKPEDFRVSKSSGGMFQAVPAVDVVNSFIKRSGRSDVIKLVSTYEAGLYGNTHVRSTNGYEVRRQNALAEVSSARLKAGAAASAIVLAPIKLRPGESTDGAVFFQGAGKTLGPGHLVVRIAGETFDFELSE
jgi:hypothetical protein